MVYTFIGAALIRLLLDVAFDNLAHRVAWLARLQQTLPAETNGRHLSCSRTFKIGQKLLILEGRLE